MSTPPIKDIGFNQSGHTDLAANGNQRAAALPPAATSIGLLPAFCLNQNQPDYSDADRALVDAHAAHIAAYWQAVPTDNIVPFIRRSSATQKPQQAHPAIQGMSLRKMRELGARLKIRGARRWNTQQAIEALTRYYSTAA